jgi:hypothetical protein
VTMPIWDTWFTPYDVFTVGPDAADDLGSAHEFHITRQLTSLHGSPANAADALLGFNKFSREYVNHIWDNDYYTTEGLLAVQEGCESEGLTLCPINNFPFSGVSLKPVFLPVSSNGVTIIPVWRGVFPTGTSENPSTTWTIDSSDGVGANTWLQCVAIDTSGTYNVGDVITDITSANDSQGDVLISCSEATVVSMDEFYHLTVTQEDLDVSQVQQPFLSKISQLDTESNEVQQQAIQAGDSGVFVAMHITTREIPQWVWMTIWWSLQPEVGTQLPIQYATTQDVIGDGAMYDNYPGGGADRPDSIGAPWNNYIFCTNYQYVNPAQDLDDPPNSELPPEICFNPYLEAGFPHNVTPPNGGINTSCMACHGNANWNGRNIPNAPGYISAQYIPRNDAQFDNVLQTDFVWSISGNVQPPPTPTPAGN